MSERALLDDPGRYPQVDRGDAGSLIRDWPEQLEAGELLAAGLSPPAEVERVAFLGMGGSGVAGRLVAAYLASRVAKPFAVIRDFDAPAWVDRRTLAVLISYSGNTLETLTAAQQAFERGAAAVAVTSGGKLAEWGQTRGFPVMTLPPGRPPRCSLGYMSAALLAYFGAGGWFPFEGIAPVAAHLRSLWRVWGFETPLAANPAKQLALALAEEGCTAVYGAGPWCEVAAERFRTQLEENAKYLAAGHAFPELCHNELVAFEAPTAAARSLHAVVLRPAAENALAAKQVDATLELMAPAVRAITVLKPGIRDELPAFYELIFFGDLVSYYLALVRGIDPKPVPNIVKLKARLDG